MEIIKVENVSKEFIVKDGVVPALTNITLSIPDRSIYGIIGRSGSGKTTFIRCLNLLERPTSGRILVNGKDLCGLSHNELKLLRRRIGMVFQHFNLLVNRTVRENISLPLEIAGIAKKERAVTVDELIETVGLAEQQNRYPAQLSGGQKQRVGIARALALDPLLLLCDEATSALDPETTGSILELLDRINKERWKTVIIVTHDMTVVRKICNYVAVLDNGQVVEHGAVADVLGNPQHTTTKCLLREQVAFSAYNFDQDISQGAVNVP
jgi:D-methionine transport system ATP-binding protein